MNINLVRSVVCTTHLHQVANGSFYEERKAVITLTIAAEKTSSHQMVAEIPQQYGTIHASHYQVKVKNLLEIFGVLSLGEIQKKTHTHVIDPHIVMVIEVRTYQVLPKHCQMY